MAAAAVEVAPVSVAEYVRSLGNSLNRSRVLGLGEMGSLSTKASTPDVTTRYAFEREIGRGHIGVVRLCRDLVTEKEYACKTILKSSIQTEEDVNELWSEVLSMLRMQQKLPDHEGIVRLHEVYDDDESTHLIMDYCCGGDLFSHIDCRKQLSEPETAYILKQLVKALDKVHSCELIHRDLKPENILLTEPAGEKGAKYKLKVADFGLCVPVSRDRKARGVAGSSFYMAPEVILERPYGKEVDVWSLGVITYTCLAGWLPFWGEGVEAVFEAVCTTKPDFKSQPWPGISFGVQNLICRMLERDPAKRIAVADILRHPWMLRHCPELAQEELAALKSSLMPGRAPGTKGREGKSKRKGAKGARDKADRKAQAQAQAQVQVTQAQAQALAQAQATQALAQVQRQAQGQMGRPGALRERGDSAKAHPAPGAAPLPVPPPQEAGKPKADPGFLLPVSAEPRRGGVIVEMDPEPTLPMAHHMCGPQLFFNKALREGGMCAPHFLFTGLNAHKRLGRLAADEEDGDGGVIRLHNVKVPAVETVEGAAAYDVSTDYASGAETFGSCTETDDARGSRRRAKRGGAAEAQGGKSQGSGREVGSSQAVPARMSTRDGPFLTPTESEGSETEFEDAKPELNEVRMLDELVSRAQAEERAAAAAPLPAAAAPAPARPKTSHGRRGAKGGEANARPRSSAGSRRSARLTEGRGDDSVAPSSTTVAADSKASVDHLKREAQQAVAVPVGKGAGPRRKTVALSRTGSVEAVAAPPGRVGGLVAAAEETETEQEMEMHTAGETDAETDAERAGGPGQHQGKEGQGLKEGAAGEETGVIWMPLNYFVREEMPPLVVLPAVEPMKATPRRFGGARAKAARPPSPEGPLDVEGMFSSSGELAEQEKGKGEPVQAASEVSVAADGKGTGRKGKGKGRFGGIWRFRSQQGEVGA